MDEKAKVDLLKKFQEALEKHSKDIEFNEVPSFHHGLMESYLILEQLLGVDPNKINF